MAPNPTHAAVGNDPQMALRRRSEHAAERHIRRGLGAFLLWCHGRMSRPVDLGADTWIVAPHQDDEVLGCGGTIALKRKAGAQVRVVFLTDGSMSHHDSVDGRILARRRVQEALRACEMLGVAADHVHFLALADGSLHTQVEVCTSRLRLLFDQYPFPQVFVPNAFEIPSDHTAAREAARAALRDAAPQRTIVEYGVWSWHSWPLVRLDPGGNPARRLGRRLKQLTRTTRWLWSCRFAVDVSSITGLKEQALRAHVSQAIGLPETTGAMTLYKVSDGDFVSMLMGPREIFGIPARENRRRGMRQPC